MEARKRPPPREDSSVISDRKGKLIAVIGDEDTCVGFLLGGVGEINKNRQPNFMVVDKNTAVGDIEDTFKQFVKRDDIDIILINQNVAEMIRHVIDGHTQPVPAVLEIPSKDHPYDASKDSILRRAKGMFNPEDIH
ncbi:V-type proton ATPase subunit F isoform X1 [Chelonus insularis]|uniref:V-type proton ATPase subunit F isoform X1 n=1 Tax=Chelonus insularis TaxID=460826 RepID=UPI00158C36B4|nr:V-type proton ATPase subunit F isoform X1 [Chelonus insularis]